MPKVDGFKGKVEGAKSAPKWPSWGGKLSTKGKTQSEGHNENKLAGTTVPKLGK